MSQTIEDLLMIVSAMGAVLVIFLFVRTLSRVVDVIAAVLKRRDLRGPLEYRVGRLSFATSRFDRWTGRTLIFGPADEAVSRFLRRLDHARNFAQRTGRRPRRLMKFRDTFRRIARDAPLAGLSSALAHRTADGQRIAIWLLGRTRQKAGIPIVVAYSADAPQLVRREAARALRRLEAWAELRSVADQEVDAVIRRLAMPRPARAHAERLTRFLGPRAAASDEQALAPSRMPLVVNVEIGPRRAPRPVEWIRTLLERIHRAVHGNGVRPSGNGT